MFAVLYNIVVYTIMNTTTYLYNNEYNYILFDG